jgi:capsular exopolysaccharide synthesis family protein
MDLHTLLLVTRRHRLAVAATALVAVAAVSVFASSRSPSYTASATLRLVPVSVFQTDLVRADDVTYLDRLTSTYAKLATSQSMRQRLRTKAGLGFDPVVSAEGIPSTELMKVSVADTDPARAARTANDLAQLLMSEVRSTEDVTSRQVEEAFRREIQQAASALATDRARYTTLLDQLPAGRPPSAEMLRLQQVIALAAQNISTQEAQFAQQQLLLQQRSNALTLAESASVPTSASGPGVALLIVIGAIGGLLAGIGVAFLRENFNDKLYSSVEVEDAGMGRILGSVPNSSARSVRRGQILDVDPMMKDAFRRLALAVTASSRRASSVLMTSAEPGEGKTTIAANLAVALAESGRSVVLIDADIRSPKVHEVFGLENSNGLSDIIEGRVDVKDAVQASDHPNLHVLTSGPWTNLPGVLLGSDEMTELHSYLTGVFDHVLYDTPALLSVADALPLVRLTDRVICVVRSAFSGRQSLQMVSRQLSLMGVDRPEIVINRVNEFREYPSYLEQAPYQTEGGG